MNLIFPNYLHDYVEIEKLSSLIIEYGFQPNHNNEMLSTSDPVDSLINFHELR